MTLPLLDGRRILVVEDEYFIASDLKRLLTECRATVVGPVGDLAAGLALARSQAIDAAILDINLNADHSYALADRLAERGVPHLFLTGYDAWSLPPRYRDIPRITKPFAAGALVDIVARMCGMERPS